MCYSCKILCCSIIRLLTPFQKNCRIGVNRCSHTGCPEAKLMYLHLKTCSAGPGSPCPTEYKGCGDARKLLAHYRRCRDIRARQASNPRVQQHVCLVCTLVARQVKGSLDSIRSNSPRNRRSKHLIPSLNLSSEGKMKNPNQLGAPVLNRPRSMSPPRTSRSVSSFSLLDHEGKGSCSTPKKMPPPLPRFPFSNRAGLSEQLKRCERPSADVNPAEDDILGKSLDSATGFSRSRARSLDIRQTYGNFCHVDWEEDQRPLESASLSDEKEPASEDTQVQPRLKGRRRSASCTVPSSSHSSSGVCDTIHEEPVGEELQRILEGDT